MSSLMQFLRIFIFGMLCLSLAGCSFPPRIYKMDVRQGNAISEEMIGCLKRGMSKEEVQDILGTPALQHMLNSDRWDYYYYFKSGTSDTEVEKHFTVFFKQGRLMRWQ